MRDRQNLRVAACQILTDPEPATSADKVIHWLRLAAAEGVEAVAFPEACLCGYAAGDDYWRQARPAPFAAAEARVAAAAADLGLAVVLGTAHWEGDDGPYNSLVVIDAAGEVTGRYAKTHLAEGWPRPGRRLPLLSVAGVPSCFLICHDVRYPELVRLPAAAGARLCWFVSNESGLLEEYKLSAYRAMPIARATENSIWLVMANAPGNPRDVASPSQSHGNSMIVHPDGRVLAEAGHFEERLVVADLDLAAATGAMARRALEDDTVLREWMAAGLDLVDRGPDVER